MASLGNKAKYRLPNYTLRAADPIDSAASPVYFQFAPFQCFQQVGTLKRVDIHFKLMYGILYRSTGQGERTRATLLETIRQHQGLSRNELVLASGLTYDQIRRQVSNLCSDGLIRCDHSGSVRRYYLR